MPRTARTVLIGFAGVGIAGAAALFSITTYYKLSLADLFPSQHKKAPIENPIPEPPSGENLHPLTGAPLWHRIFVCVKRAIHLIRVFTPFLAVTLIVSWTSDQRWRDYWLDMMIATLESAGCSFMKFGQWLSMRPDLLPPDVIRALGRLRNDAPMHSYALTRAAIRDSFGCEVEELFERFDPVPVASGTIAQVHRAVLRAPHELPGGGREVAVKVRHPNIIEESYVDTRLLFEALDVVGRLFLGTSQPFDKDAFNMALQRQVDLKWEAYNLQIFASNFSGEHQIAFPQVASSLLSESVLVETWLNGRVVHDLFDEAGASMVIAEHARTAEAFRALPEPVRQQRIHLAKTIFDMNIKMFLRDNFIHGDLHGGNLMAVEDGTLAVFDAGLTTALRPDMAQPFGYFLQALCAGTVDRVVDKLVEFCDQGPRNAADTAGLRSDIDKLMGQFVSADGLRAPGGAPINMGELVGAILAIVQRRHMQLRGDVAVTIMTMAISESLIRSLDPDFDLVKEALPYFVRYRSWRPQHTDLTSSAWHTESTATNGGLPTHAGFKQHQTTLVG